MFIKITGFHAPNEGNGLVLPRELRNPPSNHSHVILALIRWLSPHPLAILRDDEKRPVCPSPFEFNHALWTFTKLASERTCFADARILQRQRGFFDDKNPVDEHLFASYDLVQPETLDTFINCTIIDRQRSKILETITLPFP